VTDRSDSRRYERIGILGGTLDPVHFGHLRSAEEVREQLGLDQILLVPAARPPHKLSGSITPFFHRFRMAELAVDGVPGFSVSDMEGQRPGPSYSIDTLVRLRQLYQGAQLFFIIGADAFLDLGSWKSYEQIPSQARLVVVSRPGISMEQMINRVEGLFPDARQVAGLEGGMPQFETGRGGKILFVHVTLLDISSTNIRQRSRSGLSVRFLLPEKVLEYMTENQIYVRRKTGSEDGRRSGEDLLDSESLARRIYREVVDNKGEKVVVLDMRGISPVADFFIIAQGRSTKQVQGMASRMKRDLSREHIRCQGIEGESEGSWILMDFDDVVVHLFYEPVRGFFDLEGLWYEVPRMPWGYDDKAGKGPEQES